ncbi:MAG: hypothetical protein QNJ60_05365 [Xenococcaceae cyanobacterium MO_188.B19]|nr:hypothetical protein [Xenococcaceae cyanobacterium MO_188.B19]
MTSQFFYFNQPQTLSLNFRPEQKKIFLKGFWIVSGLSCYFITTSQANFLSIISALIIAIAALYPSYLWCRNRAKGLPLFPVLAINFLFTHSFPLINNHKQIAKYTPSQHFIASLIVASFLIVATFCWLSYVEKTPPKNGYSKEFSKTQVFPFFISSLILRIIYEVGIISGFLWLILPGPLISVVRALTGSIVVLAIVTISYLLGGKLLTKNQAFLFLSLMIILLFVTGVGLYLNSFGLYIFLGCVGWMLGSKKIPWRLLLISFLILSFLNMGKGATRAYYWHRSNSTIQTSEYIQVYKRWIDNSLQQIRKTEDVIQYEDKRKDNNNLIERSSLIHMLLKVQTATGTEKPYLEGKTYSIIPQLLVPRFLNKDKIRGGSGNHMLTVYYGLQSYKATFRTSIGWGLLQEAYANFGWVGCLGLGLFLGNLYGWLTRWSMNSSTLSFRFLVALLFLMLAFKGEFTMGSFVSVAFQSLIILFGIRMFFMKTVIVTSQC